MAEIKKIKVDTRWVENMLVEVKARDLTQYVDQPLAGGGTNKGMTPLEYELAALTSCMITIGLIVARQKRLALKGLSASVEGELDYDVLMGKAKEPRAGFYKIKVNFKIDADISKEEKEGLLKEIEARCPVGDNLSNKTPVEVVLVE
ncbi:MAG TPA: OsmC family protein [Candidatus Hydrothermia bacterium]|nr:OsmC family protein [Candidatus Hydrothermae bacterium]MDD3649537.1 OsmC family protein [Candidatus Hydrothermia bacterium]MDD5572271.1 OsmC family protein [Candidatus Hydrothermia bacterium]HOK23414.1 OsmC family protein [Candidatus Hydrothermia bacterium]HOL23990.1 OsmC family protein [Candidatus Hydrothermia bacterium]